MYLFVWCCFEYLLDVMLFGAFAWCICFRDVVLVMLIYKLEIMTFWFRSSASCSYYFLVGVGSGDAMTLWACRDTVTESWLLTFVTCSCFLDPCHMAISRDLDSTWTCCLCLSSEFVEEFIGGASFLTLYRMLASAAANSTFGTYRLPVKNCLS